MLDAAIWERMRRAFRYVWPSRMHMRNAFRITEASDGLGIQAPALMASETTLTMPSARSMVGT